MVYLKMEKRMFLQRFSLRTSYGLMALALLAMPGNLLAVCGPGSHWVASCAGGTDTLQLQATVSTSLLPPIQLSGPITVLRGAAQNNQIPAEVVSMTLTGSEAGLSISGGDGI